MILSDEEIEEILADADFDISAVYVLGNGEFDLNSSETSEKIDRAFKEAMKEARRKHNDAGVPLIVSGNGGIVYIQPDEIEID